MAVPDYGYRHFMPSLCEQVVEHEAYDRASKHTDKETEACFDPSFHI